MNRIKQIVDYFLPNEKKNVEQRDIIHGNVNLGSLIEGTRGEVTEEEAMSIPAVKASVELIASSVANLPIKLYKKNKNGEVVEVEDDHRTYLLNNEPNNLVNGYTFKHKMAKDLLLHGNHYVNITTLSDNRIQALHSLPTKDITVQKYIKRGYVNYADIYLNNSEANDGEVRFQPEDLIIFLKASDDGVTGRGVLEDNTKTFQLALKELEYSDNLLENGAVPMATLQTDVKLTNAAIERLKRSFQDSYQGSKNTGKTLILEDGLQYKPISLKPNELELTESKRATLSNIARIFNVPESMINSEANKYSSNEQNNIHFLQYCLAPILTSIEMALNKALLLEREKIGGYFFEVDTSNVLQTTQKEKVEAITTAYKGNLMTINEARRGLKLSNITESDFYKIGLGDVLVDSETGVMTVPNIGRLIDPEELDSEVSASDLLEIEKKLKAIKEIKEYEMLKQEGKSDEILSDEEVEEDDDDV